MLASANDPYTGSGQKYVRPQTIDVNILIKFMSTAYYLSAKFNTGNEHYFWAGWSFNRRCYAQKMPMLAALVGRFC